MADSGEPNHRPINYWLLWLFDAALVSGGVLFFLARQYGSYEFFALACLMALLPFIPVMVLVGGAGSTVFALTKVWITKRALTRPAALALLVGPALVVTLALGLWGAGKSPGHRLAYICLGNAPASAGNIHLTGYSTFLHEEWLAVFTTGQTDFESMVSRSKLELIDEFEFKKVLASTAVKRTRLFQRLPALDHARYFKRVFNEGEEHQRGSVYALFDSATATAVVLREYRD